MNHFAFVSADFADFWHLLENWSVEKLMLMLVKPELLVGFRFSMVAREATSPTFDYLSTDCETVAET